MLSYSQFTEARKNPELNPKIGGYEAISKYLDDDVYISFRNVNKLGINPSSSYGTPNGIYCYRLQSYKHKFANASSLDNVFPFFGVNVYGYHDGEETKIKKSLGADYGVVSSKSVPYIYVFKSREDNKILRLGDLSYDDVLSLIKKALEVDSRVKDWYESVLEDDIKKKKRLFKDSSFDLFIDILKRDKNVEYDIVRQLYDALKRFGFTLVEDSYYYELESLVLERVEDLKEYCLSLLEDVDYNTEDLNLHPDHIKRILGELTDILDDIDNHIKSLNEMGLEKQILDYCKREARVKSPGGVFWNLSYNVYSGVANLRGTPQVNKWSAFFRKMGWIGVDDSKGESIIHSNEPYQTVFFNKRDIKVIESVLNKTYNYVKPNDKDKKPENNISKLNTEDYNVFYDYDNDPYFLVTKKHEFFCTSQAISQIRNDFDLLGKTWYVPSANRLEDYEIYNPGDLEKDKEYWIGGGMVYKNGKGYYKDTGKAYLRLYTYGEN